MKRAAASDDDIFEAALHRLETSPDSADLWRLYFALKNAPVPVVMYDIDGTITWANNAMLGVFFGLKGPKAPRAAAHEVFGKQITSIFPLYLHEYVLENNHKVWTTQLAQFEPDWSDQEWVEAVWDVVRYPVNSTKIVAILVPKDDETVKRCQKAATSET